MTQAVPEQRPQLPGFSKWLAPQVGAVKKKLSFLGSRIGPTQVARSLWGRCAWAPPLFARVELRLH